MLHAVLSIAGSDPSGGAGIQADLKTISAHGAYAMAAITALTAQNTVGVRAVHVPPAEFLHEQLDAVSADLRVDAVKIGMLAEAEVVEVVADWLVSHRPPHVVLDPVMVARSGHRLLAPRAVQVLRDRLLPLVDVVTPNLPELADLLGCDEAACWDNAVEQARQLAGGSGVRVLVKGGHLGGPTSPDALVEPDGRTRELPGQRVATPNTHGTGCTLSSAIAALRPVRAGWYEAAHDAKLWLAGAIAAADDVAVGRGSGPVHHFYDAACDEHARTQVAGQPFTRRVWTATQGVRKAIDDLPFVRGLADGTVPDEIFREYLRQDGLYLQQYARALATLSVLADRVDDQLLWADSAQQALVVERSLHEAWVGPADTGPRADGAPAASAACTAYTSYLLGVAHRGDYPELVAAVLPCFWVYADVGQRLLVATDGRSDHPYRGWIDQYADEAFAARTKQVCALADRVAAQGGADVNARMEAAFATATRYEWMFWDAPWRGEHWPV